MSEDELVAAFVAGRLPRRAFVRQLVERGMPLGDALAFAERLVPEVRPPAAEPSTPLPDADARRVMASQPVQAEGLDIAPVGDGYTILDPSRKRVHSLNGSAVLVFELCTGENDSAAIARLVQKAFGLATAPVAETSSCLESLHRERLIV